ncbi:MAG: type III-A CRISPR-associated RAMP protein Csm5 [Nitrospinae bacterium]|nr:type III-A CRISPR-associated RAMP protein Csm5 [Nitrospinota bacterium]
MKHYTLKFEILSPLHIGAGEEMDPMSYIIKGNRLYRVSFEKFVSRMDESQRSEFESVIAKGNLVDLRRHVIKKLDLESEALYSVEASMQISKLYDSKIGDMENQLLIHQFLRTEDAAFPLIPGSSLKGAIRTALVSEMAGRSGLPKPREPREEYEFEFKVLGCKDAKEDPFRGVKIRDKTLSHDAAIVREIRNMAKGKGRGLQPNSIQIIAETTHSKITGKEVHFETDLLIDDGLFSTRFLGKTITIDQIVKSCTDFYMDKMEMEHDKFYKGSAAESTSTFLLNTEFDDDSFPLRLGRFSGVESVTLDEYRNPKPPGKTGKWGTSKNLAEEKYPMGWVKVTVECKD